MQIAPAISVILPVFRGEGTIRAALASVMVSGLPPAMIEVALAPDDGRDYSAFVPDGLRWVQAPVGPIATGTGPARNRAMAIASAPCLAFLDADDGWEPGYLSRAVPLAGEDGACFAPTSVLKDGREILRTAPGAHIGLDELGRAGTVHRPVVMRDVAGRFRDLPLPGVLHAVEILARLGGRARLSDRAYQLRPHDDSVARRTGLSREASDSYRAIIADIGAGRTRVPPDFRVMAQEVFRRKLRLNAEYEAQREMPGYYEFIALKLAREARAVA